MACKSTFVKFMANAGRIAGDRNLEFTPQRHQLTSRYGIFYKQNDQINPDKMNEIFTALTQILTEIENDCRTQ